MTYLEGFNVVFFCFCSLLFFFKNKKNCPIFLKYLKSSTLIKYFVNMFANVIKIVLLFFKKYSQTFKKISLLKIVLKYSIKFSLKHFFLKKFSKFWKNVCTLKKYSHLANNANCFDKFFSFFENAQKLKNNSAFKKCSQIFKTLQFLNLLNFDFFFCKTEWKKNKARKEIMRYSTLDLTIT